MTAIYSLPSSISDRFRFRSKPVRADAIKVVIPTYNDWDGLRLTVDSLLKLTIPPKKICVANDNPTHGVPDWLAQYPVEVVDYTGNLGPAFPPTSSARRATPSPSTSDWALGCVTNCPFRRCWPDYWQPSKIAPDCLTTSGMVTVRS